MTHDLFGDIRSLLQRPMSAHVWIELTRLLDLIEDDELEQHITPYLLAHFERAHNEVARHPPQSWVVPDLSDARRRAYSKLICIPCPRCETLCDQSDVTRALKIRHGKHYTRHVRTRDIMTTQRKDAPWECSGCRDKVPCPICDRTLSFAEVTQAMACVHGAGDAARIAAVRLLDHEPARPWGCLTCQADDTIELSAHVIRSDWPVEVSNEEAHGMYQDIPSSCKACGTRFIFTAEEQFVWYQRYGIPEGVEGMWGYVDRIVRTRCDACQRLHIAQKRIGQILDTLEPDNPDHHQALMRHYTTLGNFEKVNMHRNILNRIKEA